MFTEWAQYEKEQLEVPDSLVADAVERVSQEIHTHIPSYAFDVQITGLHVEDYFKPEQLEIGIKILIKGKYQEDIGARVKSAQVIYENRYTWEYYRTQISWEKFS